MVSPRNWALSVSMLLYLSFDTGRSELVGSEAPRSSGVLGLNYCQMSIFYTLFVTLGGRELAWGPGAEPPEVQGFWAINYCQMSMLLYLICDTGRSRIA